uniref:GIY-YIG domain-containing protein n=1 Tax=Dactylella sp. TaxID=1814903 RepID=A0A482DU06_9PEZI|nr:hypothetical protein [Dactylella sp.]
MKIFLFFNSSLIFFTTEIKRNLFLLGLVLYLWKTDCFCFKSFYLIFIEDNLLLEIIPFIIYNNVKKDRKLIIEENNKKPGIYKWTNKISEKSYIGSAIDLSKRLKDYLSPSYLEKELLKHNSIIYKAILKYGYDNFKLEILEHSNKENLIEREQHFIDTIKPAYNICSTAGSSFNRPTRLETRDKLKAAWIIRKENQVGVKHVEVTDLETGNTVTYNSIRETAVALNTSHTLIRKYINNQQIFLNKYKLTIKT